MAETLPAESAYFPGEFLTAEDYAQAQAFQIGMQRRGAAALITWGIVEGLSVGVAGAGGDVSVGTGWAIDGRGRLVTLPSPRIMAPPPSAMGVAALTIAFQEVPAPRTPGAPAYVIEAADLAWRPQSSGFDPSIDLVLGVYQPGATPPFTGASRQYAGALAGTVAFRNPLNAFTPAITGWSDDTHTGLRINAPEVTLRPVDGLPPPPGGSTFAVEGGRLGVGVMSPAAALDVLGPNVALTGPGAITSFGLLVRGDSPDLVTTIHLHDILIVTDRQGAQRQSRVVKITEVGDLLTETALNCENAPFHFQQALLTSIRDQAGDPVLSIDREAWVGFGVAFPQAQLHVGAGDLGLSLGAARLIRFDGDATVGSLDGASRLAFLTETPKLEIHQDGAIEWLPGRASSPMPVGMILTEDGQVGVGTMTPQDPLDVVGLIYSESVGFIFPDGTIQATAEAGVPIGTVIDWWRGQTDLAPPTNYQICDGAIVTDAKSPFHGMQTPNLADSFVVGVTDPSQAGKASGANSHQHAYSVPSHTHPYPHTHPQITGAQTGESSENDGMAGAPDNNAQAKHNHAFTVNIGMQTQAESSANSDAGQQAETTAASLVPPYVGLLKLIRIT